MSILEDWESSVSQVLDEPCKVIWTNTYYFFTQKCIEDPTEDGLQSGRDDIEGNVVLDTVVVEVPEMDVQV
jgi:hypothetical protein